MESTRIFIAYAHKDTSLCAKLVMHLNPLIRSGLITVWYDRAISAGVEWKNAINEQINTAHLILLLISSDFVNSEYCYGIEMKQAMERHYSGDTRIIPILLRPVLLGNMPFSKLQPLPTNAVPVTTWYNRDEAFLNIAEGIRKVLEELEVQMPQVSGLSRAEATVESSGYVFKTSASASYQAIVPTGLPRPATLVGRDAELAALMAQLRAGKTSGICALNGMGGIGKTAIAAEAVARLCQDRERFPGGAAWIFCEGLAGLEGLNEIWARVARILRLEQISAIHHPETRRLELATVLTRIPHLLLAVDNVEPQLDAEILLDTLAVPDHTTLLLTARQTIRPERLTLIKLRPLLETDGTTLFTQRLRQIDSNRPTKEETALIPQIISALGGLPLAIELVAAYAGVQYLPLAHIVWELGQDNVEATSLNSDPERALMSRFNRSWAVLSSKEQRLFAGLSLLGTTFLRDIVVKLAMVARYGREKLERLRTEKFTQALLNETTKQAQQDIAKLVTYALVEPIAEKRLRLHPLLREYSANRMRELPYGVRADLENAITDFWREYVQTYSSYEGLSGIEANTMWETREQLAKEAFRELGQDTSLHIPTLKGHAAELRQIGNYVGENGERDHGRKRLLESLEFSMAAKDTEGTGKCFQYLALLDENEGNYISAIKYYYEALRLFEQIQSQDINTVRMSLRQLQRKLESKDS